MGSTNNILCVGPLFGFYRTQPPPHIFCLVAPLGSNSADKDPGSYADFSAIPSGSYNANVPGGIVLWVTDSSGLNYVSFLVYALLPSGLGMG